MQLRMAVVGLRFGEAWARIYAAHPDVALAALCDLEQERARALAAELGVPHAAGTLEELLATDVDAVHLVTPAPLHAAQAIAALRALIPKRRQPASHMRATNRIARGAAAV